MIWKLLGLEWRVHDKELMLVLAKKKKQQVRIGYQVHGIIWVDDQHELALTRSNSTELCTW
jgi:predicted RNA-binding protein (virulence factor B family)